MSVGFTSGFPSAIGKSNPTARKTKQIATQTYLRIGIGGSAGGEIEMGMRVVGGGSACVFQVQALSSGDASEEA